MSTCDQCQHFQAGICSQFGKAPPSLEFAARCRHYAHDEAAIVVPARTCADCERYDRDNLGEWCLFAIEADCITFKPLPFIHGESCPLT